jgi:hypothetical protein
MTRKRKYKKYIPSIKIVSEKIDKKWKFNSETKKFSHPIYADKVFNPLCHNKKHDYIDAYVDKYGKKHYKNRTEIISTLYPFIPTEEDPRNLGYNIATNNSSYHFITISNKMQSFWDTRRGKRYIKYIEYRKQRDITKKLFLETSK